MGKGLQRKQVEQYETQRNDALTAETDALLSGVNPEKERRLDAASTSKNPPKGSTLIARPTADGKSVEFLRGDVVCGSTDTAVVEELGAPLAASIFQVLSDEDGVLHMRAGPVGDRKRVRPPRTKR